MEFEKPIIAPKPKNVTLKPGYCVLKEIEIGKFRFLVKIN